MPGLTKRALDAAKPRDKDYFLWCGDTPGFGARVHPTGRKVFVTQVRVGRAIRRVGIGTYGPFTVDQARQRAGEVIRAAAEGRDPQREKREVREAITVAGLCDAYLEAARAGLVTTRFRRPKRPSTIAIDEGRVARHVKPLIGGLAAGDLTRADVQRLADAVAEGRTAGVFAGRPRGRAVVTGGSGTATRVVELLGGVWSWAEKRGLVPAGPNPVRGVETVRGEVKDRTLSGAELAALGGALRDAGSSAPLASAALRLIALTGLRRDEACSLRWAEVDGPGRCLRLESTKTGRSTRPVGWAALELLRTLPRLSDTWVFPGRDGAGRADLKKALAGLFDAAGLTGVRSHDLRRTFASAAAEEGYSDATIGELLGHARRGVTARHYIRRPDAALVAAADRVSGLIAAALDGESGAGTRSVEVVELRRSA